MIKTVIEYKTRIFHGWEWLSVPAVILCVAFIIIYTTARIDPGIFNRGCTFCPLKLDRLQVEPGVITVGEKATLLDGLCNNSDKPVFTQITLLLEPYASALAQTTITLSDSMRNIDPHSCPVPGSIPVASVPDTIPPGRWRLTARITGTSESGRRQVLPKSSNYFIVLSPTSIIEPGETPTPQDPTTTPTVVQP